LNKRIDRVDAIDQRLVKTNFGKTYAEFSLEEDRDIDGIHGSEPSAEQQRGVVREGLLVPLLEEQFSWIFANLFPMVDVFSSNRQIKKSAREIEDVPCRSGMPEKACDTEPVRP